MKLIKRIKQFDSKLGDSVTYKAIDSITNILLTLAVSALMILTIAHVLIGIN